MLEYLEESAKRLVEEFGQFWALPYACEKALLKLIALRDAEILTRIEIDKHIEEADTLPPEKETDEKTKLDNSI